MDELISRQAAIDAVEYRHGIDASEALERLPTIDAEPVRHGRWIGGELGECSVCGHVGCASDIWTGCDDFYCPNCGAKMDGERRTDERFD